MKRGILAAAGGTLALAVLVILFVRAVGNAPPGTFDRLRSAHGLPIVLGTLLIFAGQAARGVRLELLLPKGERIGLVRSAALAGASTFLLQIVPFRGGEVASFALYRRILGVSWTRSAAVFVLVKVVDGAAILIIGLFGAAHIAHRRGEDGLAAPSSWPPPSPFSASSRFQRPAPPPCFGFSRACPRARAVAAPPWSSSPASASPARSRGRTSSPSPARSRT